MMYMDYKVQISYKRGCKSNLISYVPKIQFLIIMSIFNDKLIKLNISQTIRILPLSYIHKGNEKGILKKLSI